ncbi:putative B3 domain-containing protein Os03g0621600 [Telopea speciosissima]|uniref:putative B3 domain-containing protein Os03g0621600 n=1 Tax=Telopea speciosissima TaxID=54955 RepID=UPI001CC4329E|nr:putative B3 domain-containing protein Os03g0621600 [Telopea speciosissima]
MGRERRHRPSFFKVLLGDFSRRLKIPSDFVKHFKKNRPKKFILQSTNGKSWRVRVKKIKGSWFLQRGWQLFVMYHSLQVGDFLVFEFNGKSKFRVTVYDRSACEKELPIYHIRKPRRRTLRNKFMLLQFVGGAIVPVKQRSIKSTITPEAVSSFKTEHPHFIHILRRSRKYFVTVPKALAFQYELLSKGSMVLQVPHGMSQTVKIVRSKDGRFNLTSGWLVFQKENNLSDGDACIFEFIRGMGNAFCVHIFRARSLASAPAPASASEVVEVDPSSYCASPTETVKMLTYDNPSDDATENSQGKK